MMTMSHTPGPWVAHTLMVKARHETVCHLGTSNNFHPPRPEECVANARLIAAAPELLDALSNLASWFLPQEAVGGSNARLFKGMPPHAVVRDALAAIDKATGA